MKKITLVCSLTIAALMSATPAGTFAQETSPVIPVITGGMQQPAAPVTPAAPVPAIRVVDAANTSEPVVSMVFDETPLTDVIKAFRDATGANIISGGTNLSANVSVRLDNVPWRKGLSSILDQQGLALLEQPAGSGIYVVTGKTLAEVPKVTRTFELVHAKADDVAKLFVITLGKGGTATPFPSANVVIITAPEQQIGECEAILKSIDKPRLQVYIEARFVEMTAAASKKLGVRWDALGGDGVGFNFDGAKLGFSDDKGSASTKKFGNSGATSSKTTETLTDTFNNDIRNITTELAGESILNRGTSRSYDSSATHNRTRTFTGSLSVDAFSLAINAFEHLDGASVFSNPKIIVANEETAKVDMTTKEPNVEVDFQAATQVGQRDSVSTKLAIIPGKTDPFVGEAFFSYGITLQVTPRISPSGMITVDILPAISELESYYKPSGLDENQPVARYPIIRMKRMETTFTMASGTTAVIGGLTKTTEGSGNSGIPMLKDLPWIGPRLFGWKSRDKEQKEIIIFVTVGLANPESMREDIGLPKNAVFGRDVLNRKVKEPGDRTLEDLMSLKDPQSPRAQHDSVITEREAEEVTPVAIEKPAAEVAPETSAK